MHIIPEADRPASWVLSSGSATSYTDVDFGAYVPSGVKALLLKFSLLFNGDGTLEFVYALLREADSTTTDTDKIVRPILRYTDLGSGSDATIGGQLIVRSTASGVVGYKVSHALCDFWLNIEGYYI